MTMPSLNNQLRLLQSQKELAELRSKLFNDNKLKNIDTVEEINKNIERIKGKIYIANNPDCLKE